MGAHARRNGRRAQAAVGADPPRTAMGRDGARFGWVALRVLVWLGLVGMMRS
jgi:hypothetical protein